VRQLARVVFQPARLPREVIRRWPWASLDSKLKWDALDYPGYAYGLHQAAQQALALGLPRISAVELGVAGGRGLVALESHARAMKSRFGIDIDVYGFDLGSGMPEPHDYRDMPYIWKPGYFAMNEDVLRGRLQTAEVILGDVAVTVPEFLARPDLPPIGFAAFDLDYYSSTVAALTLLEADPGLLLPRVLCYFDDVIGDDWELHSEYTGELLAITEFNARHSERKLAQIHGLQYKRAIAAEWHAKLFVLHDFTHPLYAQHIGRPDWQIHLA
jgi:hypothetical protein